MVTTPSGRLGLRRRPWTRAGIVAVSGHVFYELAAGVGMPLASVLGPAPAAALFSTSAAAGLREAGRQPRSRDAAFAVLNGLFLSVVIAHFTSWPRTRIAGLPWLTECEGLSGRLMPPYNAILYFSGVSAIGGLAENRGRRWGLLVPPVVTPALRYAQRHEHARLCAQARRRQGWWNRRLQGR